MAVRSGGVPVKTQTAKGLESLSKMIAEGAINVVPSPAVNVAAENTRVVDTTGVSSIDITEEGVFHVTMKSGDVEAVPSIQSQVVNPVTINSQGETQMNAPITTEAKTTTEVVGNISAAQAAATAPVEPVATATEPVASAPTPVVESAISRLFSSESAWKEDEQSSLEVPVQIKNVRGRINMIEDVLFDHEKRINALEKNKSSGGHVTFSREKSWEDIGYNTASAVVVGVGAVTGVYLATKALNAIFGSEPATE